MEKRTILAVVLSVVVIMTFQFLMPKQEPVKRPVVTPDHSAAGQSNPREITVPLEAAVPVAAEEEYVSETDRFIFTFSNIGGAIKKIELKEYKDSKTEKPYVLLEINDPRYFVGAFNLAGAASTLKAPYTLKTDGSRVIYTLYDREIEIVKIFNLHNYNDYIDLHVVIRNVSQRQIRDDSRIVVGANIEKKDAMAQRYVSISAKASGKLIRDTRNATRAGDISWAALNNKYFCIVARPYQLAGKVITESLKAGYIAGTMESAPVNLYPGSETTQQFLYYIGPLDANRIGKVDSNLQEVVNYGFFDKISKVLLKILGFFHRLLRNWGVAIIMLTVLVNFIMYPLTRKSYRSMRAMQELQPHIDKLRGMHKDNPQKLNKELMGLYRQYNVNPLGGCLPIFLQMPIFISLYHALMRSINLKGASFLWIKDLSKPDAVPLPFSLPVIGNSINILPIFMMVAMIFQQKLSMSNRSSGMSEQQKQQQNMMMLMPVIFVAIFYSLPSGLVLYWVVNTILMTVHQYSIKKSFAAA